MDAEQQTRSETGKAASDLLDRHRNGEIVLSDRARELASLLFFPVHDEDLREMFGDLEELLIGGKQDEAQRLADAIDNRIREAAEELTALLDAPDADKP